MSAIEHYITELREQRLRIENLIHIGMQMQFPSLPAAVEDAFGMDHEAIADAMGIPAAELFALGDAELVDALKIKYQKQGFLVEFATPVPSGASAQSDAYCLSWGHYQTKWFYAESLDACCAMALAWKKAMS